jgi:hypothetical protein
LIAAADLFAANPDGVKPLFDSVPGLSPEVRQRLVSNWLTVCDDGGMAPSAIGAHRERLVVYGYALSVVREAALVAQERGDADREQGDEPG